MGLQCHQNIKIKAVALVLAGHHAAVTQLPVPPAKPVLFTHIPPAEFFSLLQKLTTIYCKPSVQPTSTKHQAGREAQRFIPVEEWRNRDFAAGSSLYCSEYKLTYAGYPCGAFQPPDKLNSSACCGWHTSLHGAGHYTTPLSMKKEQASQMAFSC